MLKFIGLHTDFHANEDKDLLKLMNKEELKAQIENLGVDFVQCDCKGHPGYTSYPTEIGATAPYLKNDNIKIWREVSNELGLPLFLHYSGIWDTQAIKEHPEYARVNADGNRDLYMTCPLSDYDNIRLIQQLLEVSEKYGVDGFWVDGENWAVAPCYCERCKEKFTKEFGEVPYNSNDKNWEKWLQFHRQNFLNHVTKYIEKVKEKFPNMMICSNWMNTIRQPEKVSVPVDYISGDFDPIWSVQKVTCESRIMKNQDIDWNLMQWAFTSYAYDCEQPVTFKTVQAMCLEAALTFSSGGKVVIYASPLRDGRFVDWQMERIKEAVAFVRKRESYVTNRTPVYQLGVLHGKEHYYSCNQPLFNLGEVAAKPVEGAVNLGIECGVSTDILTSDNYCDKIDGFKAIIIPEQTVLNKNIIDKTLEFANNGGTVILTGESIKFFADILEAEIIDERVDKAIQIGDGAIRILNGFLQVKSKNCVTYLLNDICTGKQKSESELAAVLNKKIGKGRIIAVCADICSHYAKAHYFELRELLKSLLPMNDMYHIIDMPNVQLFTWEKDSKLSLDIVNVTPEIPLNNVNNIIETVKPTENIKVYVPHNIENVVAMPDNEKLTLHTDGGSSIIEINKLHIHTNIVEL